MQVYGRGLKRRLPPMLGGDPRRIRMVYSLLFSLPGTPVLFYGEEIGMGEDLAAEGRLAVRTPMQWADGKNGGFSSAEEADLVARPVQGEYGPDAVNAAGPGRTRSLSSTSWPASSAATGSARNLAGEVSKSSPSPILRSWPTAAPGTPQAWSWFTTSLPPRLR